MADGKEILRKSGLRITDVRLSVFDRLSKSDVALSNMDLEESFEAVDRVTLYRTLKTFEDKGLIHKVFDGAGGSKYALCEHHCDEHHHHDDHVHFNCHTCGNTFCVEGVRIPRIEMPEGFQATETAVYVSGRCERCQ